MLPSCSQGRRGQEGAAALQEAEDLVPRGSEDCLCSGSLLETSDPSRSVFSLPPQGKGCFYSQLGGTEPFHLHGSFKFLRKSYTGSLGLPRGRWRCCRVVQPCPIPGAGSPALLFGKGVGRSHFYSCGAFQAQLSGVPRGAFPLLQKCHTKKKIPQVMGRCRGSIGNNLRFAETSESLSSPAGTWWDWQKLFPELTLRKLNSKHPFC